MRLKPPPDREDNPGRSPVTVATRDLTSGRRDRGAQDCLADAGIGVLCTAGTRCQLCSVSKQFAAAAVMLLAESGIDVGEPVVRWPH